jgi:hypothetical protein
VVRSSEIAVSSGNAVAASARNVSPGNVSIKHVTPRSCSICVASNQRTVFATLSMRSRATSSPVKLDRREGRCELVAHREHERRVRRNVDAQQPDVTRATLPGHG